MWQNLKKFFNLFVLLVSASLPLAIVLVGVIGGLILTAALILMLMLCRRHLSRNCSVDRFKSGSDITSFTTQRSGSKRDRKSGGSDSDNSGDYKIDIRTTSSLSNQDLDSNWDELEDRPTTTTTTITGAATTLPGHGSSSNNNNSSTRTLPSGRYPPQVMTNGGLVYHQHQHQQHYANGHIQSDYVDAGRLLASAKSVHTVRRIAK